MAQAEMGVFVGNDPAGVRDFEDAVGATVDTVLGYTGGASWEDMDPGWQLSGEFLGGSGRPINWSIPMYPHDGGVEALREVAAGDRNATYADFARKILDSRAGDDGPIWVRTAWELGGEWFPWTADAQADPEAFREAFRQFADSFHGVSDRFRIVWDAVPDRGPQEHLYPGDEAVDAIGQDAYWQDAYLSGDPVADFETVKSGHERGLDWTADFAAEHGKPLAVPEWGAAGEGAEAWVDLMDGWIDANDVAFANWWDGGEGSGYDSEVRYGNHANVLPAVSAAFADRGGGGGEGVPPGPAPADPGQPAEEEEPDPMDPDPIDEPVDDPVEGDPVDPDPAGEDPAGEDEGDLDDDGPVVPVVDPPAAPEEEEDAGGGYGYPAADDWDAVADLVVAYHAETGVWADLDTIVAAGFVPPDEGGGGGGDPPGEVPDGYPAADDWDGIADLVQAYFDEFGRWASFEEIVGEGWLPGGGGGVVDPPGEDPGPADPVLVTGGEGRDNVTLDRVHGAVVDLNGNRDVLTLGADHSDVTVVLEPGEGNRDAIHGFAEGDLLELRGFGEGAALEAVGGGEYRVRYTAAGAEEAMRFTLTGIVLGDGDYAFA